MCDTFTRRQGVEGNRKKEIARSTYSRTEAESERGGPVVGGNDA